MTFDCYRSFFLLLFSCLLIACEPVSHQDVKDFIAESKGRQPGNIKPLLTYAPYQPHVYDATSLRSPFEPPTLVQKKVLAAKSNVKPDLERRKQPLEKFEFSSLSMVGSVKKDDVLWALIRDPEGSITRVKKGYYLGQNHGRIESLSEQKIDVVEVVPNGLEGWLERPNVISIRERQ